MKITAIVGSARKKHTYRAVKSFLEQLRSESKIDPEIIFLHEYNVRTCKGCKICFDKGEKYCSIKDDRDLLIQKMMESDGIVFASPVYSFQVSSLMKTYIDRCAFLFHRPVFFGKTFTCIVPQGTYGGKKTVKYLNFIGSAMGFNVVKGTVIKSLEPLTDKGLEKNEGKIRKLAKKFSSALNKSKFPKPSALKLALFRLSRTSLKLMLSDNYIDYRYYRDQGWFDSDYYYQVKLGLWKKVIGKTADTLAKMSVKKS